MWVAEGEVEVLAPWPAPTGLWHTALWRDGAVGQVPHPCHCVCKVCWTAAAALALLAAGVGVLWALVQTAAVPWVAACCTPTKTCPPA